MLRSMLYVRYGSGCRRRQTASAARPSAIRSRQSNSATPSSNVSRSPSTAFCKMRVTVEVKAHPSPGQAQLAGQHIIVVQSRLLARAQVKVNDIAQVAPAKTGIQPEPRRFAMRDLADAGGAPAFRLAERFRDAAEFGAVAHRPEGVNERQTGPVEPLLAQVERMRE